MAINKVVYGNTTLIDLTDDDVTASDVRNGVYFHSPDGVRSQGTLVSTSTPTANTIAEWDSDAHMNSADMTSQEVDDFVDGLNPQYLRSAPIIVKTYTTPSITVSANGANWVYSLDLHPDAVSGYTPVGCFNSTPNNQSSLICQMTFNFEIYGSRFVGVIRNMTSGSLSDTFTIPVLYLRNDLL